MFAVFYQIVRAIQQNSQSDFFVAFLSAIVLRRHRFSPRFFHVFPFLAHVQNSSTLLRLLRLKFNERLLYIFSVQLCSFSLRFLISSVRSVFRGNTKLRLKSNLWSKKMHVNRPWNKLKGSQLKLACYLVMCDMSCNGCILTFSCHWNRRSPVAALCCNLTDVESQRSQTLIA